MTVERPAGLGPLGWRLLAAFLLVALSSVVLLSLAALVGTDRGITAAREADRAEATRATAAAAGAAYTSAGGWVSADLGPARAIAAGADARLFVLDRNEQVVLSPGGACCQVHPCRPRPRGRTGQARSRSLVLKDPDSMEPTTISFVLIAVLWTGYFVLEGFDFGVGVLLPFVAGGESERRLVAGSIGPVWDGNEVWLLVAGGATFAAFPEWYATLFSGFYLPLFLILLGLIRTRCGAGVPRQG